MDYSDEEKIEKIKLEIETALQAKDFEKAAKLRDEEMALSESSQPKNKNKIDIRDKNLTRKIVIVAYNIIGLSVGWYAGLILIYPALVIFIIWWISKKTVKFLPQDMIKAFAVQLGHLVAMFLAALSMGQGMNVALESSIALMLSLWLLVKPGMASVIGSALYQTITLVVNVLVFFSSPIGSSENKGVTVAIILRLAVIIYMIRGLLEIRKGSVTGRCPVYGMNTKEA